VGLKPGDRIVAVDGHVPRDLEEMLLTLRYRFAGDRVRLKVERAGEKKPLEFEVTLAERPDAGADDGKVPPPAVTGTPATTPASTEPPGAPPK
jgi:hypothetical protein